MWIKTIYYKCKQNISYFKHFWVIEKSLKNIVRNFFLYICYYIYYVDYN